SAAIKHAEKVIGYLGRLHPALAQAFDLPIDVYLFELALANLPPQPVPLSHPVSRFPSVQRDFAFLVNRQQAVGDVLSFVRQQLGALC
ncbi:hypothetical protein ACO1LZ_14875, partial [Staphylococcus aureus]